MRQHLVGTVMRVGDEALGPLGPCIAHDALDQRHPGHRHQRLGQRLGDRPQPGAEAGGQQHHIGESGGVAHGRIRPGEGDDVQCGMGPVQQAQTGVLKPPDRLPHSPHERLHLHGIGRLGVME